MTTMKLMMIKLLKWSVRFEIKHNSLFTSLNTVFVICTILENYYSEELQNMPKTLQ